MLFKSKLKACLATEFSYALLTNHTDTFRMIWNGNNSLFTNGLISKFFNRFIRLYVLFDTGYMSFIHDDFIVITPVNSNILIVYTNVQCVKFNMD